MDKKIVLFDLIRLRGSITRSIVKYLTILGLIALLLAISSFVFGHYLIQELNVLNYLFILSTVLIIILLTSLTFILIALVKNIIQPLSVAEKMIMENYNEIIGVGTNKSEIFIAPDSRGKIDKIVEVVITRQRESWNRELTSNILRQEAKMAALQSQINPHFLYNTLESIRGFAVMQDVPEIADMTEALALLFRNNTRRIGTMITLEDEITTVEYYIVIQKFRFKDKFSFNVFINEDDKEILNCKIPNFILQPIVENAIYHGLETIPQKGDIELVAYRTKSKLIIRICDNGCGMTDSDLKELNNKLNSFADALNTNQKNEIHTGIGLTNINQRLRMQYGDQYGITIASTFKIGTQVEITLPVII